MTRRLLLLFMAFTALAAVAQESDIERVEAAAAKSRSFLASGDYIKAVEQYRLARMYSPDDEADDMLRLVGSEISFATGDYNQSLALSDSVTTSRYAITAATHRVRALTMLGQYGRAVAVADSALAAVEPRHADDYAALLQNRGYARWAAGNLTPAADDLRQAAELMTNPADRLNLLGNLAIVESEAGRHDVAINLIAQVVRGLPEDSPDGIIALRKQGEILRRAGRNAQADRVFRSYYNKTRASLLNNLPAMSASERLNYWVKEKDLLGRVFAEGTDPEFLYGVALSAA